VSCAKFKIVYTIENGGTKNNFKMTVVVHFFAIFGRKYFRIYSK